MHEYCVIIKKIRRMQSAIKYLDSRESSILSRGGRYMIPIVIDQGQGCDIQKCVSRITHVRITCGCLPCEISHLNLSVFITLYLPILCQ